MASKLYPLLGLVGERSFMESHCIRCFEVQDEGLDQKND